MPKQLNLFVIYFWDWGRVQKLFLGLIIQTNNFCFLSFDLFLLYHVVLSSWWWVGGCLVMVMDSGWFPGITLSQPNYSYGCFVVGVVLLLSCDNKIEGKLEIDWYYQIRYSTNCIWLHLVDGEFVQFSLKLLMANQFAAALVSQRVQTS